MNKSFSILVCIFSLFISHTLGQVLLEWDFVGISSPPTMNSTFNSPNVAPAELSRGAGAPASAASNSFRTQGFGNDGLSLSNTDYFAFTLTTAISNPIISLESLAMRFNGTSTYAASPGVSMSWAYSFDGGAFTMLDEFVKIGVGTITFNLNNVSALQNITGVNSISFRFFASGQTNTGGWGFSNTSAQDPGLILNGTVVPEPASIGLLLFGALLVILIQYILRSKSGLATNSSSQKPKLDP
jgi:hypothetical protein